VPLSRLLAMCRRQWVVTCLGLLGVMLTAYVTLDREPVYFAQIDVIFLTPVSSQNPNALAVSANTLVATAGIIQREMDQARSDPRTSSPLISLYDQGIYSGERVRVPDTGGQWQHNFDRPVLDVQVTGSDPAAVEDRIHAIEAEIAQRLQRMQDEADVRPVNQITLKSSPPEPTVVAVTGSPVRALAAGMVLATTATILACAAVDRLRRQNRLVRDRVTAAVGA